MTKQRIFKNKPVLCNQHTNSIDLWRKHFRGKMFYRGKIVVQRKNDITEEKSKIISEEIFFPLKCNNQKTFQRKKNISDKIFTTDKIIAEEIFFPLKCHTKKIITDEKIISDKKIITDEKIIFHKKIITDEKIIAHKKYITWV